MEKEEAARTAGEEAKTVKEVVKTVGEGAKTVGEGAGTRRGGKVAEMARREEAAEKATDGSGPGEACSCTRCRDSIVQVRNVSKSWGIKWMILDKN